MHNTPDLVAHLIAELRQASQESRNEREMLMRVRPLALHAAANQAAWLRDEMCRPDSAQGFGLYALHEEPDHTLAVFVASWLPNRGTPPHDHGTWAVVAGLDGVESNTFWRRLDDRSRPGYSELGLLSEKAFGAGAVLAMPSGAIHSVWNRSDRVTVSLHIYGRHPNTTERSRFDPELRIEAPYKVAIFNAPLAGTA